MQLRASANWPPKIIIIRAEVIELIRLYFLMKIIEVKIIFRNVSPFMNVSDYVYYL